MICNNAVKERNLNIDFQGDKWVMVLEELGIERKHRSWGELFLFGVLYSSVGTLLSFWFFRNEPSLVMVFFTVLATIPLMYTTIKHEEREAENIMSEKRIFKSHGKALGLYFALFMGMVVAMSLWYVFLPHAWSDSLFKSQIDTISSINGGVTGNVIGADIFWSIVINNMQVLVLCLFFSFFYGAGAIFILAWNASGIAGAMGIFIRGKLAEAAQLIGWQKASLYFGAFSIGLFRYMTHGVFESVAYFIAGLAGSIISIAVIRHDLYERKMKRVTRDVAALMLVAIALIVLGSFVEVYVTPLLFS